MVPSQGVPYKCQGFVPRELEEPRRVEPRKFAALGLPPPLQVAEVRPPVLEAVLMLLDRETILVRVVRHLRIPLPFPPEYVTLCQVNKIRSSILIRITCRRRRRDQRVVQGDLGKEYNDQHDEQDEFRKALRAVAMPREREFEQRGLHCGAARDEGRGTKV